MFLPFSKPHQNLVARVVSVSHGFYRHVGIISDRLIDGELAVISFSQEANGFLEERMSSFSKGRHIKNEGYLGKLNPYQAVANARRLKGLPYSLKNLNCEHFVRVVHGVKKESPQLQFWGAIAGIAGAIALFG